ncbi:MAG: hypothetical protein IJX57_01675, partial [Clostridia bacterium]|nr:hypothetical protein [Clostridia bacterium]
ENDSELLSLDQSFSLFEYFGASKTFTATAAHGDGSDIVWEVGDPKYVSVSEPIVDGDKSTVNITWDGETVESIERTPFYAMLASNPFEKVTGTIYLSNGSAPEEGELDTEIEAGSKTEFESEEIKKFVEEMYAEGLTQDNSIYDLSQLDGYVEDETPDYSQMSDEEILALFEEKQAENNADTEKTEETVKENETEENTFDENKEDVNSDDDAKVDAEESENDASKEDTYNKEETQSDLTENDEEITSDETEKAADSDDDAKVDAKEAEEKVAAEKDEDEESSVKVDTADKTFTLQSLDDEEDTIAILSSETVQEEVTEEVTTTQNVETTVTETVTTEIVNEEPVVETVTKTVYEEVQTGTETQIETEEVVSEDEETGEIITETVTQAVEVPVMETVATEETVEEVVGTNYTVRETVTTQTVTTVDGEVQDTQTETAVNEYETTEEPEVGTVVDSFTTYTEEEKKEYVAKTVDVEVMSVEVQTLASEETEEISAPIVPSTLSNGSSNIEDEDEEIIIEEAPVITEDMLTEEITVEESDVTLNGSGDVSMLSVSNFDQRFQRIAVGGTIDAAQIFKNITGTSGTNIKVINSNIATVSGTTVKGKAFGRTQIVGTVDGKMSIIELEVRTSASDVAAPMVVSSANHTVALKKDGTVWTWGRNTVTSGSSQITGGQLGDGTGSTKYYPVQVLTGEQGHATGYLNNIIQVTAGANFTAALSTSGEVYMWGWNDNLQFGIDASGVARAKSKAYTTPVKMNTTQINNIKSIDAGYYHMTAIRGDGTVWTWGYNSYGVLGNGNETSQSAPQQVLKGVSTSTTDYLEDVVQVAGARHHTIALKADGSVYSWGNTQFGQLGFNTTVNTGYGRTSASGWYLNVTQPYRNTPVRVLKGAQTDSSSNYLENIVQIDASGGYSTITNDNHPYGYHFGTSLALTVDKKVYGWGSSKYGALGKNVAINPSPILVNSSGTVVQVSTGGASGLPVSASSYNWSGTMESGGYNFSYFLNEDATISSVGYNAHGELGDKTITTTATIKKVENITDITQISASSDGYFGSAIKKDGTIWVWGYNGYGQVGNGVNTGDAYNKNYNTKPVEAGTTGSNVLLIRGGTYASSIDSADGFVGIKDPTGLSKYAEGSKTNLVTNITLRVSEDGSVYDAFRIEKDQIYRKFAFSAAVDEEVLVKNLPTYTSLNPEIATVNAYGDIIPNKQGRYGSTIILAKVSETDLTITNTYEALIRVNIAHADGIAMPQVASGANHTIALRYDGTVWAWGYNANGELGNGASANIYSPIRVTGGETGEEYLSGIVEIAAGSNHNLALRKDGTVWAWGYNNYGQLGNNSTTVSRFPIQVKGLNAELNLTGIVSIAAGHLNSFALSKDGTVYAWGYNGYGTLGNGNNANQTIPVRVLGGASGSKYLEDIVEISSGRYHAMALKANGTVYTWGSAQFGQIGNGNNGGTSANGWYLNVSQPAYYSPVQVLTGAQGKTSGYLEDVVQIDASGGYAQIINDNHPYPYNFGTNLALTEDKKVYGWGSSKYGALGTGTVINNKPVLTNGSETTVHISTGGASGLTRSASSYNWGGTMDAGGYNHSLLLNKNGNLNSVGYNAQGQLGIGTKNNASTIQTVQNSENLVNNIIDISASANGYHSAALKSDGTVWTWGYNNVGQLGNGTVDLKTTPIQVGGGGSNAMHISYGYIRHSDGSKEEIGGLDEIISNVTISEDDVLVIYNDKITTKQSFSLLPDTDTMLPSQLTFSSFNEKLATVNSNGVITPVKGGYGTAIILVKSGIYQSLIRVNIKPAVTGSIARPMVVAGGAHTVALKYDGTVWAWGYNNAGQLGNNSTSNIYSPIQVQIDNTGKNFLTDVIEISAGSNHSLALKSDGTVWAWGYNGNGQLGNNTTTNSLLPVQVLGGN